MANEYLINPLLANEKDIVAVDARKRIKKK